MDIHSSYYFANKSNLKSFTFEKYNNIWGKRAFFKYRRCLMQESRKWTSFGKIYLLGIYFRILKSMEYHIFKFGKYLWKWVKNYKFLWIHCFSSELLDQNKNAESAEFLKLINSWHEEISREREYFFKNLSIKKLQLFSDLVFSYKTQTKSYFGRISKTGQFMASGDIQREPLQ